MYRDVKTCTRGRAKEHVSRPGSQFSVRAKSNAQFDLSKLHCSPRSSNWKRVDRCSRLRVRTCSYHLWPGPWHVHVISPLRFGGFAGLGEDESDRFGKGGARPVAQRLTHPRVDRSVGLSWPQAAVRAIRTGLWPAAVSCLLVWPARSDPTMSSQPRPKRA